MAVRTGVEIMKINVLCFGITKEIIGSFDYVIELPENATIGELKEQLVVKYPAFTELKSLRIAQNSEYAVVESIIKMGDEIVLIPPVSGG